MKVVAILLFLSFGCEVHADRAGDRRAGGDALLAADVPQVELQPDLPLVSDGVHSEDTRPSEEILGLDGDAAPLDVFSEEDVAFAGDAPPTTGDDVVADSGAGLIDITEDAMPLIETDVPLGEDDGGDGGDVALGGDASADGNDVPDTAEPLVETSDGPAPADVDAGVDTTVEDISDEDAAGEDVAAEDAGDDPLPLGPCVDATECDDGEPCTIDACTGGECTHVARPEGASCADDDPCTFGMACSAGICSGGSIVACEPGPNPCAPRMCVAGTGCVPTPVPDGLSCDDGAPCTLVDRCTSGICTDPDGACHDGDPCTLDFCFQGKTCAYGPREGQACPSSDACVESAWCKSGACVPATTIPCDDGNPCTIDQCVEGACVHASKPLVGCPGSPCLPADCTDGSPCTVDTCVVGKGCQHVAVDGAICEDGEECTVGDSCKGGGCQAGPPTCDDGDACTKDLCTDGVCSHLDIPSCCTPSLCDDGDPCTIDTCVTVSTCKHSPLAAFVACDDGDPCTLYETCKSGLCTPNAFACDDGLACTTDSCDDGFCAHADIPGCCESLTDCPAGPCHKYQCTDVNKPCVLIALNEGAFCNDGDVCTWGTFCVKGTCAATGLVPCADGGPCHEPACDPKTGCWKKPLDETPCDDGDLCTIDVCHIGTCVAGALCPDDGNPCTAETCTSEGCLRVLVDGPCGGGTCSGGMCVGFARPDMVWIPGGAYDVGCAANDDACGPNALPASLVTLLPFAIDRTEVPFSVLDACRDEGACSPAPLAALCVNPVGVVDPPARCLSRDEAAAVCAYAGKRLCSEAEWEVAARGATDRTWPWGHDAPTCDRANHGGCHSTPIDVIALEAGDSAFGVRQMSGNVSEWVAGSVGVVRGGTFESDADRITVTARGLVELSSRPATAGARCCVTPE